MEIEKGKTLSINTLAKSDLTKSGEREVFFELNGQMRTVIVKDKKATKVRTDNLGNLNVCIYTVQQTYQDSANPEGPGEHAFS